MANHRVSRLVEEQQPEKTVFAHLQLRSTASWEDGGTGFHYGCEAIYRGVLPGCCQVVFERDFDNIWEMEAGDQQRQLQTYFEEF